MVSSKQNLKKITGPNVCLLAHCGTVILGISSFVNPKDRLIKGGEQLDQAELIFVRKYPMVIPNITLLDVSLAHLIMFQILAPGVPQSPARQKNY